MSGVLTMIEAVGDQFRVAFDGWEVRISARYAPGRVDLPLAAVSGVAMRLPRPPLEGGGIRFSVPGDPTLDGVQVVFFSGQAREFGALYDALTVALAGGPAEPTLSLAMDHGDTELALAARLRDVGYLSDLDFGVERTGIALAC
jgi:hypothetical protein